MDKARETALKALHEVNEKGAYANVALARSLRAAKLSEVDRRFATELVYGAAKAAQQSVDREKARHYYAKLVSLCERADADRPELKEAKAFLSDK